MSQIGHNSSNRDDDAYRRREMLVIAISNWAGKRRIEETLSRRQLGALSGLDRLITLRTAALDNMRQFYVTNPQADVAPGVLTLICLMSDNSDGCCSVSVSRIATVLSRDRRNVGKALVRLEESGCIKVERRHGKSPLVWPVTNPVFAGYRRPITWVLDVHAPTNRHIGPATQPSPVVNFSAKLEADTATCDIAVAGDQEPNLRCSHPGPAIQASHNTANDTAKGNIDSESALKAENPCAIPDDLVAEYRQLYMGHRNKKSADTARNELIEMLKPHCAAGHDPLLMVAALRHSVMAAGQTAEGRQARNPYAFVNTVLRRELLRMHEEAQISANKVAAAADAEDAIKKRRIKAFADALESGKARRGGGGAGTSDSFADAVIARYRGGGTA